jgi:hypothetical protein
MLALRNDGLATSAGVDAWTERLAAALSTMRRCTEFGSGRKACRRSSKDRGLSRLQQGTIGPEPGESNHLWLGIPPA